MVAQSPGQGQLRGIVVASRGAGAPDRARPRGVVFLAREHVHVQLPHHVAERADVELVDGAPRAQQPAGEVDFRQQQALGVAVVGFCWGGSVAFLANTRMGIPAVSYYGGRTVPLLKERPKAPLMLHFGEDDPLIPPEDVAAHREALPSAEIHVWPGAGHGFNCDQRPDYVPAVAQQAMTRTLGFLQKHLR